MYERIIQEAITYISELFHGNADGHDAAHSLRVYRNAMSIAENSEESEKELSGQNAGPDKEVIALSALLHDVDDHKLFHTENNGNARAFLEKQAVAEEKIGRILEVINGVSFSKNRGKAPETIEGKIVQDADRLDAMGAIGIARTFAYGGGHGRDLESSIGHFHEKLLLLKEEMNTETGRRMAEERHAFMETFLEEYRRECEENDG